jgi:ferrous iron transport protein B
MVAQIIVRWSMLLNNDRFMKTPPVPVEISLPAALYRGDNRLRIALVGMPGSGKSTLFKAVSSTSVEQGELAGSQLAYRESRVQVGFDEASVIDLPSLRSLNQMRPAELPTLQHLLWGNQPPLVYDHDGHAPPAPHRPPDVIIQVVDASALDRQLELTLELAMLGRPLVIALNMMDQAATKGLHIHTRRLARALGVPVVATVAHMGQGIAELFRTVVQTHHEGACPLAQPCSEHIRRELQPLARVLDDPFVQQAFNVPAGFLLMQVASGDDYFHDEMGQHFPNLLEAIDTAREQARRGLPRGLAEELHADRHHRAASLFEAVTRLGAPHEGGGWRYWLDELFLHPQWGLLGSLVVFALVLFVVFEVSAWLDALTATRLVDWASAWQPQSTAGVVGRAVADGLIGLVGIVVPYMLPLVLLLVALEQSGIMHRIAFVMDRGFHRIGLHGGVAVPFLLGMGCNVPAISSAARVASGRERVIASVLITFVPCSARSAIILALAGKYLGGLGVFGIFLLTLVIIAGLGALLTRRLAERSPGQVQEIPPYALPRWGLVLRESWLRTHDILTIVTPLLVGGSVLLALLSHVGADDGINLLLTPITVWWLGLPVILGVPILFGVLRKELSLLMIYQALGGFDIAAHLDWVQLTTFLVFLTFYVPCVSTFAVMLRTLGRRQALFSLALSVSVALLVSGVVRALLETLRFAELI